MALRSGYKGFKKVGSGLSISKDGILKATGGGGGGSTVEINPEGAATAGRLNKLKVDDDIVTVSYGNATTEAAGLMSADDKTKLNGIEAQANKYVLPTASTSELGGVKVDGTTVTIADGVISATGGGGGTTVTPNPEGSATVDLTKLGIDATIYGVKDSGAYHTDDSTESTFADADYVPFYDASASAPKKSTWSNLKAKLKAYFDTIYLAAVAWSDVSSKPFSTVGDGLTVASNALKLQTASTSQLGGVKVDGTTVTIADGVISAAGGGGGGLTLTRLYNNTGSGNPNQIVLSEAYTNYSLLLFVGMNGAYRCGGGLYPTAELASNNKIGAYDNDGYIWYTISNTTTLNKDVDHTTVVKAIYGIK